MTSDRDEAALLDGVHSAGYAVIKARIGDVIVKRVGDEWHVYSLGPLVVVESLADAIGAAQRMHAARPEETEHEARGYARGIEAAAAWLIDYDPTAAGLRGLADRMRCELLKPTGGA